MSAHIANGRMVVLITIFVSMMFQIMPLPPIVEAWRPDWLLMVMIYWAMALPHRYSVLTAWVVGVLLDVLLGATLGVRSLALSIVIYLIVIQSQRLRNFTRWQQSILVALFVCLYHLIIYWVEFVVNGVGFDWSMFLPAISSIFMWWWFFWVLRNIRRRYKVR
ncbi:MULTISPECIES: rod shape-determining protein MreD [unclassified Shewanella]|uniref:rod shape-determining protein MreD n=1 Tax=unclassified Shewanella TaxID=196818 RepID=UPI000C86176F|nr:MULTISPECIES: rod shape-determining protein MreD [unclassified Shewanella]MDO6618726.1 rod shape-determining protein MreD [Shewanella sp. 6_MG-2023]MDO6639831.1 rod shape-determining protein MreD [Shewanella sp. 5_MG-2023]PMG42765.1 rod shape-determining protein MreD [Shewanella sp. 10N.286.52.B9]